MFFKGSISSSFLSINPPQCCFWQMYLSLCGRRGLLDCLMVVKVDITCSFLFPYPFRCSLSLSLALHLVSVGTDSKFNLPSQSCSGEQYVLPLPWADVCLPPSVLMSVVSTASTYTDYTLCCWNGSRHVGLFKGPYLPWNPWLAVPAEETQTRLKWSSRALTYFWTVLKLNADCGPSGLINLQSTQESVWD